jgi:CBS domain-containing protein
VHPDDPVIKAVVLMVAKEIHQVVVVDQPERIVGILSTSDVLRAVLGGRDLGSLECVDLPGLGVTGSLLHALECTSREEASSGDVAPGPAGSP